MLYKNPGPMHYRGMNVTRASLPKSAAANAAPVGQKMGMKSPQYVTVCIHGLGD